MWSIVPIRYIFLICPMYQSFPFYVHALRIRTAYMYMLTPWRYCYKYITSHFLTDDGHIWRTLKTCLWTFTLRQIFKIEFIFVQVGAFALRNEYNHLNLALLWPNMVLSQPFKLGFCNLFMDPCHFGKEDMRNIHVNKTVDYSASPTIILWSIQLAKLSITCPKFQGLSPIWS